MHQRAHNLYRAQLVRSLPKGSTPVSRLYRTTPALHMSTLQPSYPPGSACVAWYVIAWYGMVWDARHGSMVLTGIQYHARMTMTTSQYTLTVIRHLRSNVMRRPHHAAEPPEIARRGGGRDDPSSCC